MDGTLVFKGDDKDVPTKAKSWSNIVAISCTKGLHKFIVGVQRDGDIVSDYVDTNSKYKYPYVNNNIFQLGVTFDTIVENYEDALRGDLRKFIPDQNNTPQKPNDTQEHTTQTKQGCYIATCVYGSYDCPEVWTLRRFRDNTLATTWYGRLFIRTYYAISPTLVKWFGNTNWFKNLWKGKLDRMVKKMQSNGVESTPYDD